MFGFLESRAQPTVTGSSYFLGLQPCASGRSRMLTSLINAFLSVFIGAGQRCPNYSPMSSPENRYRKEASDCASNLNYHVMQERRQRGLERKETFS